MDAGRKVGVVAATVVVLGEGSPQVAPYLPDVPVLRAGGPGELVRVLAGAEGDVVFVDAGLGCSGSFPVADVCRPGASRVLVADAGTAPVRTAGGLVVSAGTSAAPLTDHEALAAGCLQVAGQHREALDEVLTDLANGPSGRLWEQILSGLVMRAVPVKPVLAAPFVVGDGPVESAPDAIGMQARRCARGGDGWLSERTVRRMSRKVTPLAVRAGLAPNTVTVISLLTGAAAVACALTGTRWGYLATALLMVVSLVLDCVDGEVARWTHRYSRVGAWLDAVGDRVKEYSIWFAVGWAVDRTDFWALILTTLVLYTVKHFLDYGWSLRYPPWRPMPVPISSEPDPWQLAGAVPPSVRPPSWRRVFGMPIAERWLLLALLLPTVGPWGAFGVLAILGAVSLAYTVLTRIRWSHRPIDARMTGELQAITDPGPLLLALRGARAAWAPAAALGFLAMFWAAYEADRPWLLVLGYAVALGLFALAYGRGPRGRLGWMSPAVSRAAEMLSLIAVAWSVSPQGVAVFSLLAAAAWRHYDVIYRIRSQGVVPGCLAWLLLLGAEGRVLVAIGLLLAFGVGAWLWFALYVAVVAVVDSVWSWFRPTSGG
jgi:hypothetical protein